MTFTPIYTFPESRRLILFFAGWSAEPEWFEKLLFDDVDLVIVTDYTTMEIPTEVRSHIESYDEIVVISWSFGVPAATRFIEDNPDLPITLRMAVNGTPMPVDDDMGIPTDIFEGTLNNLSETTLRKFDRRMCGTSVSLRRSRGIDSLKEELCSIRSNFSGNNVSDTSFWDIALIGDKDNIIPTQNQLRAWEGRTPTEIIDSPHYPDFKKIIGGRIINKRLMGENFAKRAKESYDQNAVAQARIARHLTDMLRRQTELGNLKEGVDCLEVGVGTGMLTRLYYPILVADGGLAGNGGGRSGRTSLPQGSTLTLCDISFISESLPGEKVICDAETYIRSLPSASRDLILGASVIQWFQSPTRFIEECRRVLRPGGILLLSTFSPDNYYELSPYLKVRLNGPDKEGWSGILSRNFDSYDVEEERIPVDFATPRELLYHMKATGVNGLSADSVATQRSVRQLLGSGLRRLTYCPIYLFARK